jgi:hypothetical protein
MEDIKKDSTIRGLSIQMMLLLHEFERATGMKVLDFYGQFLEGGDQRFSGHEIEITIQDESGERITGGTYSREEMTVELRAKSQQERSDC